MYLYLIHLLVFLFIYDTEGATFKVKDVINKKVYYNIDEARELFEDYVEFFDKSYNNEEYEERLELFTKKLEDINHLNTLGDTIFGLNHFTDYKDHELPGGCISGDLSAFDNVTEVDLGPLKAAPATLDWRQRNLVTPVKNQDRCNSCWAFSATGAIEGLYAITTGRLVSFSDQEVQDCSGGGNCAVGGSPERAMNGIAQLGMVSEDSYPYVNRQLQCSLDPSKVIFRFGGGQPLRVTNEEQLKEYLYNFGPLSVFVNAGKTTAWSTFQGLSIANSQTLRCAPGELPDHAVLLVGYGETQGVPYWIIKNSWGAGWGYGGYIHLLRNQNTCSIAMMPVVRAVAN